MHLPHYIASHMDQKHGAKWLCTKAFEIYLDEYDKSLFYLLDFLRYLFSHNDKKKAN